MPVDTTPKFAVGQHAAVLRNATTWNVPPGHFVVTRILPGDRAGRAYGARGVTDGLERVFGEIELQAVQPNAAPDRSRAP